jgi:hypothetical protein
MKTTDVRVSYEEDGTQTHVYEWEQHPHQRTFEFAWRPTKAVENLWISSILFR